METKIVCLANSKKYSERCVAGVEVQDTDKGYQIIYEANKPKWIRPVSQSSYGEFPARIASDINLLDIVEFEIVKPCPKSYQSENVYFAKNSVKKVSSIRLTNKNLARLIHDRLTLFGNRGKAVHEEVIDSINYSLMFIRAENYELFVKPENNQLRMKFEYNNCKYDLPITDISFESSFRRNNQILDNASNLYLTISLAIVNNGWHSKLIAGVIYI